MDGKPFKFAGANFYPAMITAAGNPPNDSTRPAAQKLLDAMPPLGLTVMRCWAFNDGPAWQSLQPSPGNYSEHVLRYCLPTGFLTRTAMWTHAGGCGRTCSVPRAQLPAQQSSGDMWPGRVRGFVGCIYSEHALRCLCSSRMKKFSGLVKKRALVA